AERDAVLLLELVLVLGPQRVDRGQVGLVEGGQRSGGLLGLDEPLGDALADAAHALPCLALARGAGRSRRSLRSLPLPARLTRLARRRLARAVPFRRVPDHILLG